MLVRKVIASLSLRSATSVGLRITSSFNTTSSTSYIESTEEPERPVRKLKEWRKLPVSEPSLLSGFQRTNEGPKPLKVIRRPLRLTPLEMRQWFKAKRVNYVKRDQAFVEERHRVLGCDLAAAHFLVYRGGKVKFHGQSDWKERNEDHTYDLPTLYDPTWLITDFDASGIALYYEGIENFKNLRRVTWASFKGNVYFDDWCLDKVSVEFPNVEYLDVSECPLLTERGLEALYRLYSLKTLIITSWHSLPSFELTCAMLEDCNPDLTIKMRDPPGTSRTEEKKQEDV